MVLTTASNTSVASTVTLFTCAFSVFPTVPANPSPFTNILYSGELAFLTLSTTAAVFCSKLTPSFPLVTSKFLSWPSKSLSHHMSASLPSDPRPFVSFLCLTKMGFLRPPFCNASPSFHPNDCKYELAFIPLPVLSSLSWIYIFSGLRCSSSIAMQVHQLTYYFSYAGIHPFEC